MITYYFIVVLLGALQAVVLPMTILPDITFSTSLNSSLSGMGASIHVFSLVLPATVPTIFAIFVSFIGIEAGILGFKLIKWVYSKIPGIN